MKSRYFSAALTATALLLGASLSSANENKTDTRREAATKPGHMARIKRVDINSATKAELKKLPGISDAQADKIIADRPFGSKAWLVTHKIISIATYQAVKGLVVCKLSKKDISKIMAQPTRKSDK
jgi:competence protein ComEA